MAACRSRTAHPHPVGSPDAPPCGWCPPLGLPDTGVSFLDVISSNSCSFLSELSIMGVWYYAKKGLCYFAELRKMIIFAIDYDKGYDKDYTSISLSGWPSAWKGYGQHESLLAFMVSWPLSSSSVWPHHHRWFLLRHALWNCAVWCKMHSGGHKDQAEKF